MLIDQVEITIKAGNGGNGLVHLLSSRRQPRGGPDGGDGGDGGSVYFQAQSDITLLNQFRHLKKFSAQNGDPGHVKKMSGKNGQDLILNLPVGSVINFPDGASIELTQVGQSVLAAKGGRGGQGNHHYATSVNRAPKYAQPGQVVEPMVIFIELKLIADVGLIGLPNAGKTSLLNELTAAHAKTAAYPFTTLEPNLGVAKGNIIIADIPGLIDGASRGKGLGVRFLRHIERTRLLVHCISQESTDPARDYQIIRQELKNYNPLLLAKPEIIVSTKSDLANPVAYKSDLSVSILDDKSISSLQKLISTRLSSREASS